MKHAVIAVLLLGVVAVGAAKQGRTYYTPEKIEAARENVARFEWAQKQNALILGSEPAKGAIGDSYVGADRLMKLSDDAIFALMPDITIPRKRDDDAPTTLCPVHGSDIRRYGAHQPWKLDHENHPFKVICPVGGESYPSNDFAAGDMTSGEYPDDGSGCVVDGQKYQFVRYAAHRMYLEYTVPALRGLSMAYLLTGQKEYGAKAAILLAGIADQQPGPKYHSEHCYGGPYGHRSGLVTDYIWSNIVAVPIAQCYDAIYPIYEEAPEVLEFLRAKGLPAATATDAREFVEERILRQTMQALLDVAIQGNPGHHQLAALTIGLVLDDHSDAHPNSYDVVKGAYYNGYAPAAWIFSNGVTRDGGGYEGPGYDRIKFNYIQVGLLMERLRAMHPGVYDLTTFPNILDQPKAKKMYEFYIDTCSLGFFTPPVGDAGGERLRPGIIPRRYYAPYRHFYLDGFRIYREPRYAKALLGLEGTMPDVDLFEPSIEDEIRDAAASALAGIDAETRLLDHYGFAYLNDGEAGPFERETCINYTALRGHQQADYLSLYLFAHEQAHLPDLGYPFGWDYRWQWDANIYAHNTVGVDGCNPVLPHAVPRGWVSLIGDRLGVQAAVTNHTPYPYDPELEPTMPPVERYERICVMVGEDERESYLLDLFIVKGGREHHLSWHSVLRDPTLPELAWADQPTGTAAGPEVAWDGKYTNLRGQETQNAMCYVTGVKRAPLTEHAVFDWNYQLAEPTGLRLHVVPVDGQKELIFGNGRPPSRPEEWRLPYLFVRNPDTGVEGLGSRFLSILEPYRADGPSRIKAASATGGWPLVVTVEREGAIDEITINAPAPEGGIERGDLREVGISVRTSEGGQLARTVTFGSVPGAEGDGILRGQIVALDRDENTITVSGSLPTGRSAARFVRIHSPGRSSMYTVISAQAGEGDTTILHLTDTSLLGCGIPVSYRDGIIDNDVCLPFATGRVAEDGTLHDFMCRFEGARVENSDRSASLRLRGINGAGWINGSRDYDLFLEDRLSPAALEAAFGPADGSSRFEVHDYGIGDSYEVILTRAEK